MSSLLSILIGGGILAFIEFLITRYDAKHNKEKEILDALENLQNEVTSIKEEAECRAAIEARGHILRFRDELYNDIKHSQEYFEQVLDDIAVYDSYCDDHPKFKNGRTKAASEYIDSEYKRLFNEHKL